MGKLHDQMREDLLLKAYSPHTQNSYLGCARHFASHYMRSPQEMGEKEVRDFLLHLIPRCIQMVAQASSLCSHRAYQMCILNATWYNPGPPSLTCHSGHACQRPQVSLHRYPETT
jgi:hypothetical protein